MNRRYRSAYATSILDQMWPGRTAHGQVQSSRQPGSSPCAEHPGHLIRRKKRSRKILQSRPAAGLLFYGVWSFDLVAVVHPRLQNCWRIFHEHFMTRNRIISWFWLASIGLTLATVAAAAECPRIYVGLPPQRWLVQQLASNRVEVGLLLSPGQNPHTFEPTAHQVKALSTAQLYLIMGLPFERVVVKKVQAIQPGLQVREMAAGVPRRDSPAHLHAGQDEDDCCEGADPHVWLTPTAMGIMASNTVAALVCFDPAGQGFYEARLAQLQLQLAQLDAELRTTLAPVRGGVLFTYHASWGYFTDAYGLRQVSIEAEGRAPAARQLVALIDLAKQAKVRRVFTEPPYDPKPSRTVARQIGADVAIIDPLAESWAANLRAVAAQVRDALIQNTSQK